MIEDFYNNDDSERDLIIEKMMSILDEDGLPMYNLEWLEENLGNVNRETLGK